MSDRLPPLTALRAFEAAARHMSFAKAAEELGVTPAALSFQIKSLEEHLGRPVFRRLNRAVELTETGRLLAPGTADGFATLAAAWRSARRLTSTSVLTVTADPAFTAKWLAPRLYGFARAHPDVDLRLSATLRRADLARDDVDVAIRFGSALDPGLDAAPLSDEWFLPMMAPALAAGLESPADLLRLPLLHLDEVAFLDPPVDWPAWFCAAGLPAPPPDGAHFGQADHAQEAAIAGAGVFLGRLSLALRDLEDGRLIAPFGPALPSAARYRMLYPRGADAQPQLRAFIAWARAEAAQDARRAARWIGRPYLSASA